MRITKEASIYENPLVDKYLKSREFGSLEQSFAIDIGCGLPNNMFDLGIFYEINTILGIDILNLKDIIKRAKVYQGADYFENAISIEDCYKFYVNEVLSDNEVSISKKKLLLKNFTNDQYQLKQSSISEFDFRKINNLDVAMAINSLDFISKEKAKVVIIELANRFREGGVFFIEVKHIENKYITGSRYAKKISDDEYFHRSNGETVRLYSSKDIKELELLFKSLKFSKFIETELYLNNPQDINSGIKSVLLSMKKM